MPSILRAQGGTIRLKIQGIIRAEKIGISTQFSEI